MSSETDHPRQRTVAELLAQHGDVSATGRRRRRREADDDEGAQPVADRAAAPAAWTPQVVPDRSVLREPVPDEAPVRDVRPRSWDAPSRQPESSRSYVPETGPEPTRAVPPVVPRNGADRNGGGNTGTAYTAAARTTAFDRSSGAFPAPTAQAPAAPPPGRPRFEPARENPTDHIPRYREDRTGVLDPGLTGPIDQQQVNALRKPPAADEPDAAGDPDPDAGPATMVGVAPAGAESWHRARTAGSSGSRSDADGGPPTQAVSSLDIDARPAGLDLDLDEPPAGLEDRDDADGDTPRRRLGRSSAEPSPGQAWAAVVAQWILGAIGGAALWVGFRFLWRELPVVALAAAVLVTVGLVLIVRALLRNSDMRTTIFAVLVGLLLTASPAILVLMGR